MATYGISWDEAVGDIQAFLSSPEGIDAAICGIMEMLATD